MIIRERKKDIKIDYSRDFYLREDPNCGLTFPWINGELSKDIPLAAKINFQDAIEHPEKYKDEGVRKHIHQYIEPPVLQCDHCKEEFDLIDEYMGACQCPKCGQWYNLFGQELLPPDQWGMDEVMDEIY